MSQVLVKESDRIIDDPTEVVEVFRVLVTLTNPPMENWNKLYISYR